MFMIVSGMRGKSQHITRHAPCITRCHHCDVTGQGAAEVYGFKRKPEAVLHRCPSTCRKRPATFLPVKVLTSDDSSFSYLGGSPIVHNAMVYRVQVVGPELGVYGLPRDNEKEETTSKSLSEANVVRHSLA